MSENIMNKPTNNLKLVLKDTNVDIEQRKKNQKIGRIFFLIFVYAFLSFMALVVIIPFYWMIITSLKSLEEYRDTVSYFPGWGEQYKVMWSNYSIVFESKSFPFFTLMKNTLIVGVFSTIGTLLTTIFAAFAFARLNFKGKDLVFSILLGTMMIPGEMMVITNYITVSNLGWLDTQLGVFASMIIPFWVSVFYIYLLRQNFKQIPNELYYAAKVDGKTDWQYLWKVMVPLASPTLITVFILKLMGAWNSYVWPNLVANKTEWKLISNGLRGATFKDDLGNPLQTAQMAATVLVTVPLLLLFIFFRKYIMRGVGRAGIKG